MTDMEKAFAIYRWTKINIGYTGTSNKDSWTIGAYQAFTKKSGDCFNYYAAAKAMLDVCGIPVSYTHLNSHQSSTKECKR